MFAVRLALCFGAYFGGRAMNLDDPFVAGYLSACAYFALSGILRHYERGAA